MTQIHNAAVQIDWDPDRFKEVDEAKKIYLKARQEGRSVIDMEGNPVDRFHPSMGTLIIKEVEVHDGQISMRIFDKTGDRRLVWNANDPEQIEDAKILFDEYVKKGWKAYGTTRHGNKGHRIYEFNSAKQEIVIDDRSTEDKLASLKKVMEKAEEKPPRTTKQKLSAFIEQFKEVKLVPRTYPG